MNTVFRNHPSFERSLDRLDVQTRTVVRAQLWVFMDAWESAGLATDLQRSWRFQKPDGIDAPRGYTYLLRRIYPTSPTRATLAFTADDRFGWWLHVWKKNPNRRFERRQYELSNARAKEWWDTGRHDKA